MSNGIDQSPTPPFFLNFYSNQWGGGDIWALLPSGGRMREGGSPSHGREIFFLNSGRKRHFLAH